LEGTLAGIAAAAAVGALGAAVALYPWAGVLPVVGAAFVGTTFESVVGAALERRRLLDNEALNFLNTLAGALAAIALPSLGLKGQGARSAGAGARGGRPRGRPCGRPRSGARGGGGRPGRDGPGDAAGERQAAALRRPGPPVHAAAAAARHRFRRGLRLR